MPEEKNRDDVLKSEFFTRWYIYVPMKYETNRNVLHFTIHVTYKLAPATFFVSLKTVINKRLHLTILRISCRFRGKYVQGFH